MELDACTLCRVHVCRQAPCSLQPVLLHLITMHVPWGFITIHTKKVSALFPADVWDTDVGMFQILKLWSCISEMAVALLRVRCSVLVLRPAVPPLCTLCPPSSPWSCLELAVISMPALFFSFSFFLFVCAMDFYECTWQKSLFTLWLWCTRLAFLLLLPNKAEKWELA